MRGLDSIKGKIVIIESNRWENYNEWIGFVKEVLELLIRLEEKGYRDVCNILCFIFIDVRVFKCGDVERIY